MKREKETVSNHWCARCRKQVPVPRWEEYKVDVKIAHCPQCGEEIGRKLK